ncbi:Preprotein translocase subunit YajC [Salmonella bongori]|nr:Preprotein translocase subunit YajC [Salmonella bongori]
MSFFISDAVAATGAPAQGSPMSLILMLVVFGLIFYFMILRPTAEAHQRAQKADGLHCER